MLSVYEEIYTALPTPQIYTIAHFEYRKKLKVSICSLIKSAAKGLGKNLSSLIKRFESLNENKRFSPLLYSLHFELKTEMQKGYAKKVGEVLEKLNNLSDEDIFAEDLQISSALTERWENIVTSEVDGITIPGYDKVQRILPVTKEEVNACTVWIKEAIKLIRTVSPEMAVEIDGYISRLKIFQGDVLVGLTDVRNFGTAYIHIPFERDHPVAYLAEHLVHETSHLHLHAIMAQDPLITNSFDEKYSAPIRIDPRPMFGVFHATFVLSRMVGVFRKLIKIPGIDPAYLKYLQRFESQFAKGMKTVEDHANCTLAGEKIRNSLLNAASLSNMVV